MKVIFEAIDGQRFDDLDECEEYEWKYNHPNIITVSFFDKNKKEYHINMHNVFDDEVYNNAFSVDIHNENELADFAALTEYCGWCEFEDIDSPGVWIRFEDEYSNAKWKKTIDKNIN